MVDELDLPRGGVNGDGFHLASMRSTAALYRKEAGNVMPAPYGRS
jgi:hypothetical protein